MAFTVSTAAAPPSWARAGEGACGAAAARGPLALRAVSGRPELAPPAVRGGEGPACHPQNLPHHQNAGLHPSACVPRCCPASRVPLPSRPSPSEWIRDYTDSVPDPEALRVDVDTFMETYDKKMAEVGLLHGRLSVACGAVGTERP